MQKKSIKEIDYEDLPGTCVLLKTLLHTSEFQTLKSTEPLKENHTFYHLINAGKSVVGLSSLFSVDFSFPI